MVLRSLWDAGLLDRGCGENAEAGLGRALGGFRGHNAVCGGLCPVVADHGSAGGAPGDRLVATGVAFAGA